MTLQGQQERTRWEGLFRQWFSIFLAFLGLIIVYGIFAVLTPKTFLTLRNLETILRQTAIVGTASLGMTMVIIMGGIDLAAGSVVAFCTVCIAWLLKNEMGVGSAALLGVLAGGVCGLITGLLITSLNVVPFIVTLGMFLMVRGSATYLADAQKIDAPATGLNELMAALGPEDRWQLIPGGVWMMLILAVGVAVLLKYTRFGRYVFAVGSNEQTARLCGINVTAVKVAVYALSGLLIGVAGLFQFSRLTVGDPTVAKGLELDVIAAVVIGGGSLFGGEGSVLGSLVGALIMTVIATGCAHMGYANWVQEVVTGAIIIFAVALDGLRHRQAR